MLVSCSSIEQSAIIRSVVQCLYCPNTLQHFLFLLTPVNTEWVSEGLTFHLAHNRSLQTLVFLENWLHYMPQRENTWTQKETNSNKIKLARLNMHKICTSKYVHCFYQKAIIMRTANTLKSRVCNSYALSFPVEHRPQTTRLHPAL